MPCHSQSSWHLGSPHVALLSSVDHRLADTLPISGQAITSRWFNVESLQVWLGCRVVVINQLYWVLAGERFVHRCWHSSRSTSTVAAVIAHDAATNQRRIWWVFLNDYSVLPCISQLGRSQHNKSTASSGVQSAWAHLARWWSPWHSMPVLSRWHSRGRMHLLPSLSSFSLCWQTACLCGSPY